MRRLVGRALVALASAVCVVALSACGSSGGGGNNTTINGRIQNIAQVQLELEGRHRIVRRDRSTLWGFLGTAYAQTSDITVDAVVNGEIVDSDTTDSGGRFELRVRDENKMEDVRIVFNTIPALTLDIVTIEDSEISLVLSLAPNAGVVAIETFQINTSELSCQGGESFAYVEPQVTTMTIDGGGSKECIHAQDECQFFINIGGRLNISNCSDGILAENDSEVRLTPGAMSSLNIDANGNGIRGTNNSITIVTGFDVDIAGRDFGISANRDAFVQVSVPVIGTCDIDGNKAAVDASKRAKRARGRPAGAHGAGRAGAEPGGDQRQGVGVARGAPAAGCRGQRQGDFERDVW
jgi:hypothetical protein